MTIKKRLSACYLYDGDQLEKQNMMWNMAGSICYAFASMLLSFLVMRLAGAEAGGIFAFGFSTFGQQMFTVSYYGIRPFQTTDPADEKGEYTFGDYLLHRKLTTGLAFAVSVLYLGFLVWDGSYSADKGICLFLLAAYKIIDGFADVFESEFQRQGSLYLTGKSNTFRTLFSVVCFAAALLLRRQLVDACVAAVVSQMIGVLLFDLPMAEGLTGIKWKKHGSKMKALFLNTTFLFLSVFLDFYIFSAAKYAIDGWLNDAASGYFNLIFMPTSVIYLVANFVIRPFLTRMTVCWSGGHLEQFRKILVRIGLLILGLTIFAVGMTAVLGRWVLGVMEQMLGDSYAGALTVQQPAFLVVILGGGIYACSNLMYYALVIMRRQKVIFGTYVVVAALALFLAPALVRGFGLFGGAVAYCIFMGLLLIGFMVFVCWSFYRKEHEEKWKE